MESLKMTTRLPRIDIVHSTLGTQQRGRLWCDRTEISSPAKESIYPIIRVPECSPVFLALGRINLVDHPLGGSGRTQCCLYPFLNIVLLK